nr:MAG TPA: hypothetical protein [Caudoviricetes sp.]
MKKSFSENFQNRHTLFHFAYGHLTPCSATLET